MKICGIITEYNPFHNGHALHIQRAREISGCEYIIACMSGNFVQRGEPAIFDKFIRTKAALQNGADVVIELPVFFAAQSAEYFAAYSVRLLEATGIIDSICFGSECGDLPALLAIAELLAFESQALSSEIKKLSAAGYPYPKARAEALSAIHPTQLLGSPNNILGIEYLKAILKTGSNITPLTVKRENAMYNDMKITGNIASATAIRGAIAHENYDAVGLSVPADCFDLYKSQKPVFPDDFSELLHLRLRTLDRAELPGIFEIKEGIENKILSAAEEFDNLTQIAQAVKSRRYPLTAIMRMLQNILLDIKKEEVISHFASDCQYIRVLGFKKQSAALPLLVKSSKVPVITSVKEMRRLSGAGQDMLAKEINATNLYDYVRGEKRINREYREPVVVV